MSEGYFSKVEQAEQAQDAALHMKQRRAIDNAYASLQGRQLANSFAAFTFEEAADAYIEEVEGAGTEAYPNKIERLERIRGELTQAVAVLKELPPEAFKDVNVDDSVNTSIDNA